MIPPGAPAGDTREDAAPPRLPAAVFRLLPEVAALSAPLFLTWATVLVVLGQLTTPLGVLGVGVSLLVAVLLAPRATSGPVLPSVLLMVLAGAWVLLNRPFLTTDMLLGRDPAVYTFSAAWLVDNPSLRIPVGDGRGAGSGFTQLGDAVVPQWTHAMPAVGGLLGRVFGLEGALGVNLLFGGAAVIAVFVLARRLVPDWTALLVALAFSVSLPLVFFSRGLYSEVAVTGAGMVAVATAVTLVRSWTMRSALALGLALGAVTVGRIDGLLMVAVVLPLTVLGARLLHDRRTGPTLHRLVLVLLGLTPGVVAGQADLWLLSGQYLEAHAEQLQAVLAATAVGLGLSLVVVLVPHRVATRAGRLVSGRAASAVVLVVATAFTVLVLSRPLWDVSRLSSIDNPVTENVQAVEGMFPLDGFRSYEEQLLPWLAAYLGWPTVLAGMAAMVGLLGHGLRRRDAGPVLVAAVLLVFLGYLSARSSISPDNIWAMRRSLPQLIPLALVTAGAAVHHLVRYGGPARAVAWVLAGAMVYLPLLATAPVANHVEGAGQRAVVDEICEAVGTSDVVVGGADVRITGSLRVHCGATVWVEPRPSRARLAQARRAMGGDDTVVVTVEPTSVPWVQPDVVPPPTVWRSVQRLERTLEPPPRAVLSDESRYWLGVVGPDGGVSPLAPTGAVP